MAQARRDRAEYPPWPPHAALQSGLVLRPRLLGASKSAQRDGRAALVWTPPPPCSTAEGKFSAATYPTRPRLPGSVQSKSCQQLTPLGHMPLED
ncbi:hypothetical protein N9L68_03845 [bacterium]|nr:hypothetical protein [bacterium]